MSEIKNLGKVVKRHTSGMMETDKGFKYPASATVETGHYLVQEGSTKVFIDESEFKKLFGTGPKYQKGVTKALREEADELGVDYSVATTKDELLAAIEAAKAAQADGQGGSDNE